MLLEKDGLALRGGLVARLDRDGREAHRATGFRDTEVEQLKSFGFFSEIIAWRLRLFLPIEAAPAPRPCRACS